MPPGTQAPNRLRVLHIVQNLNYGGMERLLFETVRRSRRDAFDHHVLNLQFVGRFGDGLSEYATVSVAEPMTRLSLLRPRSLARTIRNISPDIVHSHSGVWYKASLAARMAGVPWVVHTEHGRALPDPWMARRLDGAASGRTDVVIAVSEAVARLLKHGVVRHADRVHVVPNGVDVDLYRPDRHATSLHQELGIASDTPVLGSIGRLERIKGYEVMVAALAELLKVWKGGRPPVLLIAGDGSERGALEAQAEASGVSDRVRWLGWRDDIHELHATFSLFTMSSHSEGTSISLLEAMSAGLCPVVTDVGGNAAVLGEVLRHCLVPPRDPGALARAWLTAIRDPDGRRTWGSAARARVEEAFTLEAMVRTYEQLYRRNVAEGTAPP